MRYPVFLKEGGKIGFAAPSFGATTEPYRSCFKKAVKRFRKWGYETEIGPNCFADKGIGKSNTPQACAAEINHFFLEDDSDVIISCGGGETMCEDLPYIDFEGIRNADPKWFMGFSDNTNLTFTLATLCDTAAIYGPCASSFGMKPMDDSVKDALKMLKGEKLKVKNYSAWQKVSLKNEEDPYAPYNLTEPFHMTMEAQGKKTVQFSGRLIGGCMDCLINLCGTKFDQVSEFSERYKDDGIIWFLEACDLTPMGIRRALWQLDQAGWFSHVRGFLIGRALHYDEEMMGVNRLNAVTEILSKYRVPILMDVDLGHLPPTMPVIVGAMADVTASSAKAGEKDHLKIKMILK